MRSLNGATIGLGGSFFWPGADLKHSRKVIRAAFELGFSHFDVAPSYCNGWAEAVLGGCHLPRDKIKIVTKTGLFPPKHARAVGWLASFARQLTGRKKLRGPAGTGPRSIPRFDTEEMSNALTRSLRALQVEAVDALLLHEAQRHLVTNEVMDWLETQRQAGLIADYGAGTRFSDLVRLSKDFKVNVWQYSAEEALGRAGVQANQEILHGVFGGFSTWVNQNLLQEAGIEATDKIMADRLCVAAALELASGGTVLFSTRNIKNLEMIADVAQDAHLRRRAGALLATRNTNEAETPLLA